MALFWLHAVSLIRKRKISNNAYHTRVHEAGAPITLFHKAVKENDKMLEEKETCLRVLETTIIDIGNNLVNYIQKLKAT